MATMCNSYLVGWWRHSKQVSLQHLIGTFSLQLSLAIRALLSRKLFRASFLRFLAASLPVTVLPVLLFTFIRSAAISEPASTVAGLLERRLHGATQTVADVEPSAVSAAVHIIHSFASFHHVDKDGNLLHRYGKVSGYERYQSY
jgi:hypothetical protein